MRGWRTVRIGSRWPDALLRVFARLDPAEVESVRRQTRGMEYVALRNFALVLNRVSNGLLYPLLAILLLVVFGQAIVAAVLAALVSVLAAHLIYPWIKRRCCRARPFVYDVSIKSLLVPLDEHSFPSGHAMTATAAFLPVAAAVPSLWFVAIGAVGLISWARIAAGHHYPSDIAAGIVLGSVIAGPGALCVLR